MNTSKTSSSILTAEVPPITPAETATYHVLCVLSRGLLVLTLVVAPWCFGGVTTTVQLWLYATTALALAVWIPGAIWQSCWRGLDTNRLPLVFLVMFGCLGLIGIQLRHEPEMSAEKIQQNFDESIASSSNETQKRELGKASMIRSLQQLNSICPAATRLQMAKLTIVIIVFFLGTQLFVTQTAQLWLWGALAINGAALTFFGICQELTWNGKLFWFVPLRHGGLPFSSFVNRNNAAGYLLICLAAALGLLAWTSISPLELIRGMDEKLAKKIDRSRRHQVPSSVRLNFLNSLTSGQLIVAVLVILITIGVVSAASRGGWLALGIAAVVTGVMATKSRKLTTLGFVLGSGLCVIAFVSWVGFGDRINKRWSEFVSIDSITKDGRWNHWCDSLNAVSDFPLFGTGFGTYRFAYLPYQSHANSSQIRFYNADNQFLEWLVEGGIAAMSLIVLSILLMFGTVRVLLKRVRRDPIGVVGVFALASQCVNGFFDFGPTIPANMLALACLFGSVSGRAALLVNLKQLNPQSWGFSLPPAVPSVFIPCTGIIILSFASFALQEVNAASNAHNISWNLPKLDSRDSLEEKSASELIDRLSSAAVRYSDDPEVQLALADLLIYRFRLQEFQIALNAGSKLDPSMVWRQTNPAVFYQQVNSWEKAGQFERIEFLLETPTIQQNLVPALKHLNKAQSNCALVPGVSQQLALLSYIGTPTSCKAEGHLRRTLVVNPSSSEAFYNIGLFADFADLSDFSRACWKRSLELTPFYLFDIHKLVSKTLSLNDELDRIIPASEELLLKLAQSLSETSENSDRAELASRALQLLSTPTQQPPDAYHIYLTGKAQNLLGEFDSAMENYRKALNLSPFQIEWRLELTELLLKHKGAAWALKEAETCAAIAPEQKRIRDLVQNLQSKLRRSTN